MCLRNFFLLLAVSALLVACSTEEAGTTNEKGRSQICFSAVEPLTKASVSNTITGFYVGAKHADGSVFFNNEQAVASGGYWETSAKHYWPAGKLSFYAYAPTNTNGMVSASAVGTLTYTASSTDIANQPDLLVAKNMGVARAANDAPSPVLLTFDHALSKVAFTLQKGTPACTVKSISLNNVYSSGTYDLANNSWTVSTASTANYTLTVNKAVTGSEGADISLTSSADNNLLMLVPQTFPAGAVLSVSFTVNGEICTLQKDLSGQTLDKGKGINFMVSPSSLYVTTLSKVTTADVGKVVCTDGTVYNTVSIAKYSGKTPCGMIGYVGSDQSHSIPHGIVFALEDASKDYYYYNDGVVVAKTYNSSLPSNTSGWHLPSVVEWNHIIDACGGTKYAAEVSSGERWESGLLLQKMSDCGGTPFNLWYWASDGNAFLGTNGIGWNINFNNIAWWFSSKYGYVRDCFTF